MKSRLVARFLLALVLVQSLVVLLSAPVQAKPISSMNLAEQAQSWWYYNALRICLDDAGWNFNNAPGANFNQISQSDVTSGDWFEHGFVGSSNQGTVHGYFMRDALASIGNDGHMRCQDDNGQLVNKALSLWGIDAVDMLCSSTKVLKRYNNQPCDGNNQFVAADGFANRTRLILDYVDDKIGSTPQALSGAARYYYIWQSFKNSCVYENRSAGTVLGAPMNFGDEWTYMIAEPVSGEIKPVKYVGNKKKSDSVYTWPGGSQNTCGWLEGELSWNGPLVTAYADTIAANPDLDPGTDANSAGDTSGAASCNISGVGWIVCPLATFGAKITDLAYAGIEQLMVVKPVSITDFGSTNPIFAIWSSMRNFANIAFIFAFFMIIFSQATSIGLSSYGLKKMLPRLIVAAILVNLSYFICALGVDISNIIGAGIDGIINSAYTAAGPTATGNDFWSGVVGNALAGTGLFAGAVSFLAATGGAGGVGGLAGAAWGMLLPFLVTALFAVVTALVVLVGRQALLILLVIISPLAFVAYILPNTESLFTKWRKAFIAMLVFYPLVAVVFSGSKVAAQILRTTAPENTPMHELVRIMSLGVQFFPLFALPFLLKFSGGVLGRVAGMVNNPNKGPFDKLRKRAEAERDYRLNMSRRKSNEYLDKAKNPDNFRVNRRGKMVPKGIRGLLTRPYSGDMERESIHKAAQDLAAETQAKAVNSGLALRKDGSGLPIDPYFAAKMAGESRKEMKAQVALGLANQEATPARAAVDTATKTYKAADDEVKTAEATASAARASDTATVLQSLVAGEATYKATMKAAEDARARAAVARASGIAVDPADLKAIQDADDMNQRLQSEAQTRVASNGRDYEAEVDLARKVSVRTRARLDVDRATTDLSDFERRVQEAKAKTDEKALDSINRVIARGEYTIDEIEAKDLKASATLQSNLRLTGQNYKDIMQQPLGSTIVAPDGRSLVITEAMQTAAGSTMISQGRETDTVLKMAARLSDEGLRSFIVGQTKSNFTGIKPKQVALIDEGLQNDLLAGRLQTQAAFDAAYRKALKSKVSTLNNNTYASQEKPSMEVILDMLRSGEFDDQTAATLKEFSRKAITSPSIAQNIPATSLDIHKQIAAMK